MIYILYGANSIGKKSLRDAISRNYGVGIIVKYTTSTETKNEKGILTRDKGLKVARDENGNFIFDINKFNDFFKNDFSYIREKKTGNVGYAIRKKDISDALNDGSQDYILILSNYKVVTQIKEYIRDISRRCTIDSLIKVIFIAGDVRAIDDSDNDREWSKKDVIKTNREFNQAVSKFDGVIMYPTQYDEKRRYNFLFKQWDQITKMQSLEIKTQAFIIRPFSNNQKLDRCIHETISKILKDHGIQTDKYSYDPNRCMIDTIKEKIEKAGIIIVDLRDHRNNCYYELAYASSLKKEIILIVPEDQTNDIASDIQGIHYYKYQIREKNAFGINNPYTITFIAGTPGEMTIDDQIKKYCDDNYIFYNNN